MLKEGFLELLERDKEFRYAVIGYLGLDRIEKIQTAILEEIKRIWEEIKALREGRNKLWEEVSKIWKEVKALRESQENIPCFFLPHGKGRISFYRGKFY